MIILRNNTRSTLLVRSKTDKISTVFRQRFENPEFHGTIDPGIRLSGQPSCIYAARVCKPAHVPGKEEPTHRIRRSKATHARTQCAHVPRVHDVYVSSIKRSRVIADNWPRAALQCSARGYIASQKTRGGYSDFRSRSPIIGERGGGEGRERERRTVVSAR